MTDLEDFLDQPFGAALTPPNPAAPGPRPVRRHKHVWCSGCEAMDVAPHCTVPGCLLFKDDPRIRKGKNNRTRGNRQELTTARALNGTKVGPMGYPWDVVVEGYARIQVKKLATPPSLRFIAAELRKIAAAPGPEMPGFQWKEPGRDGEDLIVFRFKDYAERHGVPPVEEG